MTTKRKRNLLLILALLTIIILGVTNIVFLMDEDTNWMLQRICYLPMSHSNATTLNPTAHGDGGNHRRKLLPDISKDPPPPDSIFFHETSCAENNRISLNAR